MMTNAGDEGERERERAREGNACKLAVEDDQGQALVPDETRRGEALKASRRLSICSFSYRCLLICQMPRRLQNISRESTESQSRVQESAQSFFFSISG